MHARSHQGKPTTTPAGSAARRCQVSLIPSAPAQESINAPSAAARRAETHDPVAAILDATDGRGVDVAIDATGAPRVPGQALRCLARGGRLLQVGIRARPDALPMAEAVLQEKTIITTNGHVNAIDLPEALRLLADAGLADRVATTVVPLDHVVDDGLRPLAEHRATAKVVVDVA